MKYQETALRYAKALLVIAKEKGHLDSVLQQVAAVVKQMENQKVVLDFMNSPVSKLSNQKDLLLKFFENQPLREEVQNLLLLLVAKRRFFLLPQISRALQQEVDNINLVVRGIVRTSAALEAEDKKDIENTISKYTSRKLHLDYVEDKSIKGGVIAEVGSYTFDGSLKTQIKLMHEELLKKEQLLNGN